MKLYFTNQTSDRHNAREIELKIEQATGLVLDNPFYDGDAKEVRQLDAGEKPDMTAAEIVAVDLKRIRESSGILALFTIDRNIGSSMEVAIAAMCWGMPVYVISPHDHLRLHPWIQYFASRTFENVYEFIKFAKEELVK